MALNQNWFFFPCFLVCSYGPWPVPSLGDVTTSSVSFMCYRCCKGTACAEGLILHPVFLVTMPSGRWLVFSVIVKVKVTVLDTYLTGREIKQVLIALRGERVLSLQMKFVSRSCRHQKLKNNNLLSERSLCSHTCITSVPTYSTHCTLLLTW